VLAPVKLDDPLAHVRFESILQHAASKNKLTVNGGTQESAESIVGKKKKMAVLTVL
jgi:hypothetical protein